jgi:hypothetical protein
MHPRNLNGFYPQQDLCFMDVGCRGNKNIALFKHRIGCGNTTRRNPLPIHSYTQSQLLILTISK